MDKKKLTIIIVALATVIVAVILILRYQQEQEKDYKLRNNINWSNESSLGENPENTVWPQ